MSNKSIKFLWVAIAIIFASATTGVIANIRNQDRKISISLTEQEWSIVLNALSEMPLKTSGGVYSSIMQQAQMQLQAQQKPKSDTAKKKP